MIALHSYDAPAVQLTVSLKRRKKRTFGSFRFVLFLFLCDIFYANNISVINILRPKNISTEPPRIPALFESLVPIF